MIKELKYVIYFIIIFIFIFFTVKFYLSDLNKKKLYRSYGTIEKNILIKSTNILTLPSDTDHVIEFVENTLNKDDKQFKFWELLSNNE